MPIVVRIDVELAKRKMGVGEFAELVPAARQPDPVGQRTGLGRAGGLGDAV